MKYLSINPTKYMQDLNVCWKLQNSMKERWPKQMERDLPCLWIEKQYSEDVSYRFDVYIVMLRNILLLLIKMVCSMENAMDREAWWASQ